MLAHIARCLSDAAVNIATTRMYRTRRGAHAYTVMEVDGSVPARAKEAIERDPRVMGVRVIPADGPEGGMEGSGAVGGATASSATTIEQDAAATSAGQADSTADGMTDQQIEAAEERFARCDFTTGAELLALCGREGCSIAQAMAAREKALAALDGADAGTDEYLTRVLDVMRASTEKPLREPEQSIGGLIGGKIFEKIPVVWLAAAAAVEMAGGTPVAALDAASNALCALLGLVCDPVGGLVEIPCQKRNGSAAAVALTCAQIALAGVPNLVPFDETVAAMDAVGRTLPATLRETALGGIAAAPAACAWCAQGCG